MIMIVRLSYLIVSLHFKINIIIMIENYQRTDWPKQDWTEVFKYQKINQKPMAVEIKKIKLKQHNKP